MKYNNIDYQRSVLICMVVMIHIVNFSTLYPDVKNFINFFFMKAFLLITGYLVNIQKTRKEFATYIVKILVPYLIMVLSYAIMSLFLPVRDGIGEFTVPTILNTVFVTSIGPYWFLHTMMVCGVVYYISFHGIGNFFHGIDKLGTTGKLCVFATLLMLISQYTPLLNATHAAFYFMGACLRLSGKHLDEIIKPSLWSVLPFVAIACYSDYESWKFLSVTVLALSFLSFVPKLIQKISSKKVLQAIGFVGRNTLPIYLFHPIFTMGAKYALPLFRFDQTGGLHVIFTIVMSVVGSIAIAAFLDKYRLSCIFARKQFLR